MSPQAQQRYEILKSLARYEDAYKRALQFAIANKRDDVVDISSPLYEMVKLCKNRINELRNKLRST